MKIKLINVAYNYASDDGILLPTLNNVNLEIGENKIISVIGHTGSGKSTVSKILKGLIAPAEGSVLINGKEIAYNKKKNTILTDVGLVFQYPEHQIFETTIYRDIAFGPKNLGWSENRIHEMAVKTIELVGLTPEYLERSTLALSGGEKRRVALAGVLIMSPEILILDEPTAGLDPQGKKIILDIILNWKSQDNKTVVLITHNMETVLEISDEVIVMHEGSTVYQLPTQYLFTDFADNLERMLLDVPLPIKLLNSYNSTHDFPLITSSMKEMAVLTAIQQKIAERKKE